MSEPSSTGTKWKGIITGALRKVIILNYIVIIILLYFKYWNKLF